MFSDIPTAELIQTMVTQTTLMKLSEEQSKRKDMSVRAFCKEKVGWTDEKEVRDGKVRVKVVRMHCVHVKNCLRTNFNGGESICGTEITVFCRCCRILYTGK